MLNFDRIPYLIVYKVFLKYIHRYIGVDLFIDDPITPYTHWILLLWYHQRMLRKHCPGPSSPSNFKSSATLPLSDQPDNTKENQNYDYF